MSCSSVRALRRKDDDAARTLDRWLRRLERDYRDRILPVTLSICDRWGRLGLERSVPPVDGLLAATAMEHRLTLVTRNVAHVDRTPAAVLNPFDA